MIKKILFIFCLIAFFFSCKRNTSHVEYLSVEPEIIYDSIITRLPGKFAIKNNYFIWQDAMARDSFIHIVNTKKQIEIAKIGKIGKGPNEFRTPSLGSSSPYDLMIFDLNGNHQFFFSLDSLLKGKQHFINIKNSSRDVTTSRLSINDSTFISLCPEKKSFIFVDQPGSVKQFGKMPFSKQYSNGFYINQGHMAYNSRKKILVYAASKFPYIAIYKWKNQSLILENEVKEDFDYNYSNQKITIPGKKAGAFSASLTKNYIVTHRRHYERDNTNEQSVGMDVSKAPTTIFLHDYNGRLLRIIDLKTPIVRIYSQINNDNLFAIVANPDYSLIKYEL